jgi:hypothetical protein
VGRAAAHGGGRRPEIRASGLANSERNFGYTLDRRFEGLVIDQHDANGEMLRRFLDEPEFDDAFTSWARREAFRQIREQAAETSAPARSNRSTDSCALLHGALTRAGPESLGAGAQSAAFSFP